MDKWTDKHNGHKLKYKKCHLNWRNNWGSLLIFFLMKTRMEPNHNLNTHQDTSIYRLPRRYFSIAYQKGKNEFHKSHSKLIKYTGILSFNREPQSQTNVLKILREIHFTKHFGNRSITERIRHFVNLCFVPHSATILLITHTIP